MSHSDQASRRIAALERELEAARAELAAARAEAPLLKTLLRDFAERRQVEARLRETQEWLHLAQTAARVAAYSFDFATGRLSWSPSAYALYGVESDREPTVELWLAAIHPDDRERAAAAAAAALERGCHMDLQFRILRPDGGVRWVHDRGEVRLGEDGRPARLSGLNIDVTEQREREAALRRSEARFRALADATAPIIWRTDARGEIHAPCPEWAAYTGQAEAEYQGYGWVAAVHPEDRARAQASWKAAVASGGAYACEYRLRRRDGEHRLTLARGTPLHGADGEIVEWIGANVDIADQHRATEDLRDQKERLRAALAGSGAGTFRWDIRTNALDWDVELDRLFGLPPGETSRSLEQFLALVHPDDRAGVVARCERCAAEGADFEMTFRVVRPDGVLRWIYDRGATYRDEQGRPAYMTGACIDVTERQEQLARLRDSEERLRLAQEAGGIGAFEWRPDRDELIGTEHYHRLWGLEPSGVISGSALMQRVHPDDRRLAGPSRTHDLASALDYAEFRIFRADTGELRWLARQGQLMPAAPGEPPRLSGVVYDVTERRRAEHQLHDVLESVTDCFIALDADWRVILFNSAAERHAGLARDAVIGRTYWDTFPIHLGTPIEAALRGVMADREPLTIETPSIRRPGRHLELRISPTHEGGLAVSFSDVTARYEAERHRELLIHELNHRVKNTLAVVQATAHQTLRGGGVPAELRAAFEGRLGALASAHDILTRRNWDSAYLEELLGTALAPFVERVGERIRLSGPTLRLPAKTAVSFALAIHELATNASKYGALSNEAGEVAVSWILTRRDGAGWLKLRWDESGGPRVRPPSTRGFGSRMIERALAAELGGAVRLAFAPAGVTCVIEAPLEYLDSLMRQTSASIVPPAV